MGIVDKTLPRETHQNIPLMPWRSFSFFFLLICRSVHLHGTSPAEDDYDSQCQQSCTEGWQEFDGRCYLWVTNQERNWTEAEKFCNSEEGHLASVTSKEMHEFILEEVEKRKTKVWIGATDQESEGTWKWSDYSPFDFRGWIYNPDVDENVNCVELYNTIDGAGWNDLECGTPMHFVCASARHICPDTTRTSASSSYGSNCEASCVVSCPTGWERSGNRCYYWSKKSWSWNL